MKHLVILVTICVAVILAKEHDRHDPIDEKHYSEDGEHDEKYDHEAVLGSKDAEEEYSKMDPDEAQEKLGGLVDKMDKNQDKNIDKQELIDWIKKSFVSLNTEEAKKEFQKQDKNEDNFISWEEFLDFEHSQTPEQLAKIKAGTDAQMKEFVNIVNDDKRRFKAADKNKDGKLDSEEYDAFFHPARHPHMFEYELKKKLDELDADKDGKLNLTEYLKELDEKSRKDENTVKGETENFGKFDKNKDGILDRDEMKTWLMGDDDHNHDDELAKEEAEHLIKESDSNEDGILSKDEIVDKHTLWVGSHATNYGQHLQDEL